MGDWRPVQLGDVEIGWGEVVGTVSLRAMDAAPDAGVTFDMADACRPGRSEILIGKALQSKQG